MTGRVAMVPLDLARQLGAEIGLPAPMTTRSAFRTLANNPPLLKAVFGQLSALLLHNTFDTRLRELMIMRIGWVTGSEYEWTQHWRVATTAGIPPEDVLAVRDWQASDRLTAADRAILQATDETLAGKAIADATWAEVIKHVPDPAQQVEFVVAMGNWTMFSILLRNLQIPVEDGVMVWPPDGARPASAQGA
jgi:alkylhydroperoxidase family enzyme